MSYVQKTPNFQLPQWVLSEPPQMDDFNTAFSNIDQKAVPNIRQINTHPLSADITLTPEDLSAAPWATTKEANEGDWEVDYWKAGYKQAGFVAHKNYPSGTTEAAYTLVCYLPFSSSIVQRFPVEISNGGLLLGVTMGKIEGNGLYIATPKIDIAAEYYASAIVNIDNNLGDE